MATTQGRYVKVSNVLETTYGNASAVMAATAFNPIRVKSISFPVDRGLLQEENIDSYIPSAAYGGALKVSGSLEGYLRPKQMEILFYALMGASAALTASDTIATGFKYTLGFPQPLQIKIGESTTAATTDLELSYMGVGIKSCAININAKEIMTAKFDWFAKLYSAASTFQTGSTYTTEDPVVFYNATVAFGSGTSSLTIKSMTVNIDRKVDEDRFIVGDYTLQEIGINGMTTVSGDITFTEKEYTQFRFALFGAGATLNTLGTANMVGLNNFLLVTFNTIGGSEAPAGEIKKMFLKFNKILYGTTDTSVDGNNEITKKVTWVAVGAATDFEIGIAA